MSDVRVHVLITVDKYGMKYGYGRIVRDVVKHLKGYFNVTVGNKVKGCPDVLYVHDCYAPRKIYLAKKRCKCKVVTHVHTLNPILIGQFLREKGTLSLSDRVITVSKIMRELIKTYYGDVVSKIDVVYNCVDTKRFKPVRNPEVLDVDLIYVGRRLEGRKGFKIVLAKAMKEGLKMAAIGSRDVELLGIFHSLPKGIVLDLGYVPIRRLIRILSSGKPIVLPSTFEPFGLIALETMACKGRSIISKYAGVAEIVEPKSAIIFDPIKDSLKDVIEKAYDEIDLNKAREVAKKYDCRIIIKDIVRIINEVIE